MKVTDPNILTGLIHERLPGNWGERAVRIDDHAVQVNLPWNDGFAGAETWGGSNRPVVSGPVIMGIADTAMYGCCLAAAGPDAVPATVTITTTLWPPLFAADAESPTSGASSPMTVTRPPRDMPCHLRHPAFTSSLSRRFEKHAASRLPTAPLGSP
jgi:hypothetical protein